MDFETNPSFAQKMLIAKSIGRADQFNNFVLEKPWKCVRSFDTRWRNKMFLVHDAEKNILPLLEPEKLGKFPLFLKTKGFPKFRQDTHLLNTAAILTTRGGH